MLLACPHAGLADVQYAASRDVLLEPRFSGDAAGASVELWMSEDAGARWTLERRAPLAGPLRFGAPRDGRFGVILRVVSEQATSPPPPAVGDRADLTLVVDSTPPVFQLHASSLGRTHRDEVELVMRCTLVEENLAPSGVRVFYREGVEWIDGGAADWSPTRLRWRPPAGAIDAVDIRAVATDRAGHACASELYAVSLRPSDDSSDPDAVALAAAVTPVGAAEARPRAGDVRGGARQAPAQGASDEGAARIAAVEPAGDWRASERLREVAAALSREGRHALAAVRLQDALRADGANHAARVLLGRTLLRLGRPEEAAAHAAEALERAPRRMDVVDLAAQIALARHDYRGASALLTTAIEIDPASASHWLQLGDAELRLGRTAAATSAWRRAAADNDVRAAAETRLSRFAR